MNELTPYVRNPMQFVILFHNSTNRQISAVFGYSIQLIGVFPPQTSVPYGSHDIVIKR